MRIKKSTIYELVEQSISKYKIKLMKSISITGDFNES